MNLAEAAFTLKTKTVRRNAATFYADLLSAERMAPERLDALEWQRARAIASFAATNTEFYRERFAEVGLTDLSSLRPDDWTRIPIQDRASVKANAAAIASTEASERNVRSAMTGGSTGEPLKTKHDARVPTIALSWRMYRWWGVEPWDNLVRIGRWGFGRLDTLRNDISWWPTRQRYMDAGLISPDSMRAFHRDIVRTRPALFEGYVGAMLEFADFVEAEGLSFTPPRAIATTAAPLTRSARARLESVFRAPVYDEYRGSEVGWMAGECSERDGLHIFSDTRRVEIVDSEGTVLPAGETGEIVITDLTNRVFPLIRYKLGDRGTLLNEPCACGVTLTRMLQPDGRSTDLLRLPGGRSMGHRLMGMFAAHPESVRLFQLHQFADYSITVRVVPGDIADAQEHIERAVDALRSRVNGTVPIAIEYVESLPSTGGKLKYVISDVRAE